jgi:hypothetical protein
MWNKIKSWFGWADVNNDGKIDLADAKIVQNKVEAKIETAKVIAAEVKARAPQVKKDIQAVKTATKKVAAKANKRKPKAK